MNRAAVLLAAAVVLVTVAGCSSTPSAKPIVSTSASSASPTAPAFSTSPGQDAALIASHIPGCTGVTAGSVGGDGGSMTSTASCTLDGHVVILDSWESSTEAQLSNDLVALRTYYA